MKKKIIATAVTVLAAAIIATVVALTGAGGTAGPGRQSAPDIAGCTAAMRSQFAYAVDNPDAPQATEPAACDGLSDQQIETIVGTILGGE